MSGRGVSDAYSGCPKDSQGRRRKETSGGNQRFPGRATCARYFWSDTINKQTLSLRVTCFNGKKGQVLNQCDTLFLDSLSMSRPQSPPCSYPLVSPLNPPEESWYSWNPLINWYGAAAYRNPLRYREVSWQSTNQTTFSRQQPNEGHLLACPIPQDQHRIFEWGVRLVEKYSEIKLEPVYRLLWVCGPHVAKSW